MQISNKRREEIAIEFVKTVDPRWDLRQICDYWLNILDQELSNHTQRVREEIENVNRIEQETEWRDGQYKNGYISSVFHTLDLPSLNPTKDNEEEA